MELIIFVCIVIIVFVFIYYKNKNSTKINLNSDNLLPSHNYPNHQENTNRLDINTDLSFNEKDTKISCILDGSAINKMKVTSIRILKWYKKNGDFVNEGDIVCSHLINEKINGVDHALATGFITHFKQEDELLSNGDLIYEINEKYKPSLLSEFYEHKASIERSVNNNGKFEQKDIFHNQTMNEHINENLSEISTSNNVEKKEIITVTEYTEVIPINESLSNTQEKIPESESNYSNILINKYQLQNSETNRANIEKSTIDEEIREQTDITNNQTINNQINNNLSEISTVNNVESEEIIDVSEYSISIPKNESTNNILIDISISDSISSKKFFDQPKLQNIEPVETHKDNIFNVYNSNVNSFSNNSSDKELYPQDIYLLRDFLLILPRRYENDFIKAIPSSEKIIDEVFLKILDILNDILKSNGSSLFQELNLTRKHIKVLNEIRKSELTNDNSYFRGTNDFYIESSYYYNILRFFYYVFTASISFLKLRYNFNIKIDQVLYFLNHYKFENYKQLIIDRIQAFIGIIPDPDDETEIILNGMNSSRWKIKFNQIKEIKNRNHNDETLFNVNNLIEINRNNKSIKNIYYDCSKLLSDINLSLGLFYYSMYYYHTSKANIIPKPIPKDIKKMLLKNGNDYLTKYEELLKNERNIKLKRQQKILLDDINNLFKKERKVIHIDKIKVNDAYEEHLRLKDKLDKILNSDELCDTKRNNYNDVTSGNYINKVEERNILINKTQIELLHIFINNRNIIQENDLKIFANKYKLPHNYLVNSINELFYEKFEDNLINEKNSVFELNQEYYEEIIKLI